MPCEPFISIRSPGLISFPDCFRNDSEVSKERICSSFILPEAPSAIRGGLFADGDQKIDSAVRRISADFRMILSGIPAELVHIGQNATWRPAFLLFSTSMAARTESGLALYVSFRIVISPCRSDKSRPVLFSIAARASAAREREIPQVSPQAAAKAAL